MPTNLSDHLPRFRAEHLRDFMADVLIRLGAESKEAGATADALIHADLRGVDSHGINMFTHNRAYVPGLQGGTVNLHPDRRVLHETPTTALMDNDLGLGAAGATVAMDLAIQKARDLGSGFVAVTNGSHYGMAAHYAMRALPHGMIGFSYCNSRPHVAPAGGSRAMLGTNPIAMAAPAGEEDPFVLDMATSAVAAGKLILARRVSRSIPHGWAQTARGEMTNDPHSVEEGGWLLPLGGLIETSGYKGYGLAGMVDILSGILSGVGVSSMLVNQTGVGHFFGAIRVDGFRPLSDFTAMMDAAIREWRSTPPLDPAWPVMVPGEPEFRTERERRERGVPLHPALIADLEALGRQVGRPFPSRH